jgi:response regulator RpfG family c-di-GMP phosphodiesterase
MSEIPSLERMMATVIENQAEFKVSVAEAREEQKTMRSDISQINQRLVEIVRIEERQLGQKEALTRLGKHVDGIDERISVNEEKVNDLRVVSAKLVAKVTLLAGGSGALVSGVLIIAIQHLFNK